MAIFEKGAGLKPGFREMKWGDQPPKDAEVLDERVEEKFCFLQGDDLTFGGAPVDKIVYQYWENRLSDVYIEIPTASADRIFKDLLDSWGKPEQANKFIEDFTWKNRAPGPAGTEAVFSRNPNTRGATLLISSSYIKAKKALARPKPPAPAR